MTIPHVTDIPDRVPLSEVQKGVYLECLEEPLSLKYNIPVRLDLPSGIDEARFLQAVRRVVDESPLLHTVITAPGGVPSMEIRSFDYDIPTEDVPDVDAFCQAFARPFDLAEGPLFRFHLIHGEGKTVFLFDVHHILFDGTSVTNFANRIGDAYCDRALPTEELTAFDAALSEVHSSETEDYRKAQEFFREKLSGAEDASLPVSDCLLPDAPEGNGRFSVMTDGVISGSEIHSYTEAHGINENALFLGAFAYTLAGFSGGSSSSFSTVWHGRADKRLANALGMFVRTLPMYYDIDESMPTEDFLRKVYDDYYHTKNHSILPFGELAEMGASMAICFIYHGEMFAPVETEEGPIYITLLNTGAMQPDLDVSIIKKGDGYELIIHHRYAVYSESFARTFCESFLTVVRRMLTSERLSDLCLLSEDQRALLDDLNKTDVPFDRTQTVVDLFRAQAKKTPDNICLVFRDKRYTYREVDRITDVFAQNLVARGIGKETVTGILIPRSEYMLLCSLGVLKAGGAYLPLDPTYPSDRLNLMVQDSGAMLLIYAPEYADIITGDFTGIRLSTEELSSLSPCDVPLPTPQPHDRFIMLYTSGSTGTPKGVIFEHLNALTTTDWVKRYYAMDGESRVVSYASYGFDANVFDTYPPICSGSELHIIPEDMRLDFFALRDYFNENGITHAVMTTQVGRQFAQMKGITTLRHLSVAGEKLVPLEVPESFRMYNLYGPTEGSVVTSAFPIDRYYRDIPIGKPVDNLKLYVVDKTGKRLPPFAVGELWLSGSHVTRGYLNRPEKTAEAYGPNPFSSEDGYDRVYRTGDIVRLHADGNLQFVGRRDAQVKIRGFRIELSEVEEVIRRAPGVKDATVAAFDDAGGGKFLAAYLVSDAVIDEAAIREFIRSEKPPYMVPAVIMPIDEIPLTPNQKVNKKALPVPQRKAEAIVPPENDTQKKILAIASEVLGTDAIGIDTDLFDAGLTSIGTLKLNVLLGEEFHVAVRLGDLPQYRTVRRLETLLSDSETTVSHELLSDYPLTQTQKGIFVECSAAPDTVTYNMPILFRLDDSVDPEKLAAAVKTALSAHPYINATLFADKDGDVRARRNDGAEPTVSFISCETLPASDTLVRPFALLGEPLYRAAVYRTAGGTYLFLDIHHILSDGVSESILLSDIDKAYAGKTPTAESYTGFDAALDEEAARKSERYRTAKTYYDNIFYGCDADCLPPKAPESDTYGAASVRCPSSVDPGKILSFCEKNKLTPNAYFNAAFGYALSRFGTAEDVVYTTIYNGRSDSRLAASVMMLVKTLPVLIHTGENRPVTQLIDETQKQLLGSMSHDLFSFAEISQAYGIRSDILFVYQGDTFTFDTLCGKPAEAVSVLPDVAKAPLTLNVYLENGVFRFSADYRTDMYNESFIRAFLSGFDRALAGFMTCDNLSEVSLLSDDASEFLSRMNDTAHAFCNEPVARLFERHAAAHPKRTAVIGSGKSLSYGELNAEANRIAHALIDRGVTPDTIVALLFERTVEISLSELAILKSGGAFLGILPSYPDDRIDFCLRDAKTPIVITSAALLTSRASLFTEDKPYRALTIEELLATPDETDPDITILPENLAYCIYTSGSTGKPKGVMIEQHNLACCADPAETAYRLYHGDQSGKVALALSSISFDVSIFDNLLMLLNGKTVCIANDDEIHNPAALSELIRQNGVDTMVATPSMMTNYIGIPEFRDALRGVNAIVVGAEAFPPSLYLELKKISPQMHVINGYGPSECTMTCCAKELSGEKHITIGSPSPNTAFYVIDRFGNILPPYACGELIICGELVGRGYINLPEKNKAAFFTLNGTRAYHSGDTVRLNAAGEVEFFGRIDNQVKLRGFRVELDEIENTISSFPGVRQSKVIVRNNGSEDYLAGFFTADTEVDIPALCEYLKSKLTYYMVPDVMAQLPAMPLTPNGKIDKKALPEIKKQRRTTARRAPKKSLEQRLCEIFASVLNLPEFYADDHFFEMGGTSLSASKVTMLLMSDGIEVKYGDIFDNPTPELLAAFIEKRDGVHTDDPAESAAETDDKTRPALQWNVVKYAAEVKREPLGNVLLTGATGFLGVHVLKELLEIEDGHIYCLVRRGEHASPEVRLKTMLIYYFSDGFDDAFRDRITVIESDITDPALSDALADIPFDTLINCAACVKHFADDDILDRINVAGVQNLIHICQERNARLVQISTVSIPGIHTKESYEKQVKMHENELFVIDGSENKYILSKYKAEQCIFDAIEKGTLRAKVVRVGNLMGRHSDGEFQANMETNMFLSGIRGFVFMRKYPISHMTDPMSFSPVDCSARAVVLLAGTNDKFTAFNADSRYSFDEMKVIDACNRNGLTILPADDEAYYTEFREKLGDNRVNSLLNGLAAYDIKDAHAVATDNLFTTNILYRIGFSWPLIDDSYLDRAIASIMTLDYFNTEETSRS